MNEPVPFLILVGASVCFFLCWFVIFNHINLYLCDYRCRLTKVREASSSMRWSLFRISIRILGKQSTAEETTLYFYISFLIFLYFLLGFFIFILSWVCVDHNSQYQSESRVSKAQHKCLFVFYLSFLFSLSLFWAGFFA